MEAAQTVRMVSWPHTALLSCGNAYLEPPAAAQPAGSAYAFHDELFPHHSPPCFAQLNKGRSRARANFASGASPSRVEGAGDNKKAQ